MVFFSSVHGGQKHYENISEREMQEKNNLFLFKIKIHFTFSAFQMNGIIGEYT